MNSVLIDTNVLIYAKDKSSIFHKWAIEVIENNTSFTTLKNLSEYYSVVTKGNDPVLTPPEALDDISEFSSGFKILFSNEQSFKILESLIKKYNPKGLKVHDFEIAAIAIHHELSTIVTANVIDFKMIKGMSLISPPANKAVKSTNGKRS